MINKKRSNSFFFNRHKKVRKSKKSQLKRDISWTAFELYDLKQKEEQKEGVQDSSSETQDDAKPDEDNKTIKEVSIE